MRMLTACVVGIIAPILAACSDHLCPPAFGSVQMVAYSLAQETPDHRQRAAQCRQEAEQLQHAIQRYQLMEERYRVGSRGRSPGFNFMGRRDMAARVQHVIQFFTQEEEKLLHQAAQEDLLAQELSTSHHQETQ